jgi:phenylpyruvate tautomerase PptA (4-oxalocrotonate tautomerase family)
MQMDHDTKQVATQCFAKMVRAGGDMPTYTVTVPRGQLSALQKSRIAQEITRVHSETTGAPSYFAQVIFSEIDEGNYFVGGSPLAHRQVFVHGQIRGGRTAENKSALISSLLDAVASAASVPRTSVWIYIVDLQARQMVEFGHVLPEPGGEQAWTAALPPSDREMMQAIGPGPR